MAIRKVVVFVVALVVVWEACDGFGLCNLQQQDLMACQPAVAKDHPAKPSAGCCKAIKVLTPEDIECLCDVKNNKPNLLHYFGVDPGRCMQLPGLCEYPVAVNC